MANVKYKVSLEPFEAVLDSLDYERLLVTGNLYKYLHSEVPKIIHEDKMLNFKEVEQ